MKYGSNDSSDEAFVLYCTLSDRDLMVILYSADCALPTPALKERCRSLHLPTAHVNSTQYGLPGRTSRWSRNCPLVAGSDG